MKKETVELDKSRNKALDIMKAITIFLVVYGHCIQYLNPNIFYQNIVFKFIYSFHMPLFIFISGYLFYHTNKKKIEFKKFLYNNIRKILFPALLFGLLIGIFEFFIYDNFSISCLTIYWFLLTLFILRVLFKIVHDYFNDSIIIHIIIFIASYFIPLSISNSISPLLYMTEFFIIGYNYNRFCSKIKVDKNILLIISIIIFIVSFYFYGYNSYIFISKNYIFNKEFDMVKIILSRLFIGISAIYIIYYFSRLLSKLKISKYITKLGENSLYIYVLQRIIIEELIPLFNIKINSDYFYIITFILAITFTFICYFINHLLNKFYIWNYIFGKNIVKEYKNEKE